MNKETRSGAFRLAEQVGQFGYFGAIQLTVLICENHPLDIVVNVPQELPARWRSGLVFGLHYAIEHLPPELLKGKAFSISVDNLETNPVDTSGVLLAFIAANALWKSMGIDSRSLASFSLKDGAFVFQK